MAKKPRKTTHGGRRAGAGRKVASPEGPVEIFSISVPGDLMARFGEATKADGKKISQVITAMIRRYLQRRKL